MITIDTRFCDLRVAKSLKHHQSRVPMYPMTKKNKLGRVHSKITVREFRRPQIIGKIVDGFRLVEYLGTKGNKKNLKIYHVYKVTAVN